MHTRFYTAHLLLWRQRLLLPAAAKPRRCWQGRGMQQSRTAATATIVAAMLSVEQLYESHREVAGSVPWQRRVGSGGGGGGLRRRPDRNQTAAHPHLESVELLALAGGPAR